jgi:arylsulfatase A-like enzyme
MRSPARARFVRLACAAILALPGAAVVAAAETTKPNILLILADDQRQDAIAARGNPHVRTPTLDRLAERGVAFSGAYTMGSMIGAVCLPSRTMLLTGRSLFRIPATGPSRGGKAGPPDGGADPGPLLPRALAAAGYETYHIGKGGNEYKPGIEAFEHNVVRNDGGVEERRRSSQGHADAVLAFLRSRKADRPFFIYMAPPVPHDPRVAPKEFMDLYDPAKIPLPPAYAPVHPFDNGEMLVRDERLAPWPRTEDVIRRHLADYYAAITCLDHQIGRILDGLRELGQLDRTVVIFSSDNGLSVGDHGLMGKQNLYERGGMHVPLLFAGPGIPQGRRDALVYLFDLFPTLCELAGTPAPAAAEGKSLLPVIRGEQPGVRDCLFTAYRTCQRAVRDARWKLIRYPLIDKTQLFDLQADPYEARDLAGAPEHAETVRRLTGLLERMQQAWGDTAPLKVDDPRPAAWTPPSTPGGGARREKPE